MYKIIFSHLSTDGGSLIHTKKGAIYSGCMNECPTNSIRKDVATVLKRMTNFEFAETSSYMNHFIVALFLPHNDMDLFPKIKERKDEYL